MDCVYLIDGYSIIYRSYFAFVRNPLRNPQGRNSSSIYGFLQFLFRLKGQRSPQNLAVAMDSLIPTFRHRRYADYKANREKAPEDLHAQIPVIEKILEALGIPTLRVDGFEADDIIATVSEHCRKNSIPCYILSGDKDLLQLVGGSVKILWPAKGEQDFTEWDEPAVYENRGVKPGQIVDYLSLTGDSSDNVPGVAGIGDKTAVKLLEEFRSLQGIYTNLEKVGSESQRKKLLEGRASADLSRELVILKKDVPLGDIQDLLKPREADVGKTLALLHEEGIKSFDGEFAEAERDGGRISGGQSRGSAPGEPKSLRPGMYACVADEVSLRRWTERVKAAGEFAFDCETDALDEMEARPIGFSLAVAPGEACYIPIRSHSGEPCLSEKTVKAGLKPILTDNDLHLVGQNIKYDYKVLKRWGIEITNIAFDTMVAAWVLDATRSAYNLDKLAEDFLDYRTIHYAEVAGKDRSLLEAPLASVVDYAAEDADITYQLYRIFSEDLAEHGLADLFRRVEMPNVRILANMELAGIRLEPERLKLFSRELKRDLSSIEQSIYDACGMEFNINSTKQLQEVLFGVRKLQPRKRTKSGAASTDAQVLEALAEEDEVCANILRHRTLAKLKSTYVDSLPKMIHPETRRIHTHFLQTGTATGRLASKDPNLQNIPVREEVGRRIRSAFTAGPGCIFLSADYSQIELVVLASLSRDPVLTEAFREGRDVHTQTASLLFNVDESAVSPDMRRIGKTINFGVIYGMSAFRLSRDLKIPRKDADLFIEIYFQRYSGVDAFIKRTIEQASERGYVETIMGRRRKLLRMNSRNKTERQAEQRIAVNTPIQGSAADIVKVAMIRVTGMLEEQGLQTRLLLQVHDELIFEGPEEEADAASKLIRETMEKAVDLDVPLRVNLEKAKSWGDIH